MHTAKDLVGLPIPHHVDLTEIVNASGASFRSTSAPFEAFWDSVGMYAGDFELSIYRAPTAGGTFSDRCSAFCARLHEGIHGPAPAAWSQESLERARWLVPEGEEEEEDPDEEPFDWRGLKIGLAVWSLGHFERVCWDWKRMNARAGVPTSEEDMGLAAFMRTAGGGSFLARIFVHLAWSHGPEDVVVIGKKAKAALAKLPDPAQGVSRGRFAAFIDQDIARLRALCEDQGTLAGGLLRDPEAEIQRAVLPASDGSRQLACLETDDEWFGIDFVTS